MHYQRKSSSPVNNAPPVLAKQSSCDGEHDSSDSSNVADKKRKPSRHKWVPLDIDLKNHNRRESARNKSQPASDSQSTVSDGDRDWRAERAKDKAARVPRPASAVPRGRGRARGPRRGHFNRPPNRMPSDPDYADYPSDYLQINNYGGVDSSGYMLPFMGTFFYNSTNYVNLDSPTLKDYIKKQM